MHLAVIPARYASTRLPGKPLLLLKGKSIIRRVYERVDSCTAIDKVLVATDDRRIHEHVASFGGACVLTDKAHRNGTSRVAEAAAAYPGAKLVINVQGDEPFVDPVDLERLCGCFEDPGTDLATLAHPITNERALLSPNVVKVALAESGKALYFSRHAIPYLRDVPVGRWIDERKHLQHVGIYAFRAAVLPALVKLPTTDIEQQESLEQLRWLGAGYAIRVAMAGSIGMGIDTPEDLLAAEAMLAKE